MKYRGLPNIKKDKIYIASYWPLYYLFMKTDPYSKRTCDPIATCSYSLIPDQVFDV